LHLLPVIFQLHFLPQTRLDSQSSSKRRRTVDAFSELRTAWNLKAKDLPSRDELSNFLHRPLEDDEKIPISRAYFDRMIHRDSSSADFDCSESDLQTLFLVDSSREVREEGVFTYPFVMPMPDAHGTEDSFHSFWDAMIRHIIDAILGIDCVSIRNSNKQTSTHILRPDFGAIIRTLCLFRGEEKSPSSSDDPRKELVDKLKDWVYRPAPYIFGTVSLGDIVGI
jgi:hypothetical protein